MREIAQGAGVTAMLVNRYFGSKEKLFAEVIARIMGEPTILTPEFLASGTPSDRMASALIELTKAGATPLDGFLIMLYSGSSKRAAEIGKEQIEKHYHKVLTQALQGEFAAERAALVLSIVAGFQVMRQVIGLSALADAKPEVLVKILGPMLKQVLEAQGGTRDESAPRHP